MRLSTAGWRAAWSLRVGAWLSPNQASRCPGQAGPGRSGAGEATGLKRNAGALMEVNGANERRSRATIIRPFARFTRA